MTGWPTNGTPLRFLTTVDEYTCKCLAIQVDYKLKSGDVMEVPSGLFGQGELPEYIRADNGSEFRAGELVGWPDDLGVHCIRQPVEKWIQ